MRRDWEQALSQSSTPTSYGTGDVFTSAGARICLTTLASDETRSGHSYTIERVRSWKLSGISWTADASAAADRTESCTSAKDALGLASR